MIFLDVFLAQAMSAILLQKECGEVILVLIIAGQHKIGHPCACVYDSKTGGYFQTVHYMSHRDCAWPGSLTQDMHSSLMYWHIHVSLVQSKTYNWRYIAKGIVLY